MTLQEASAICYGSQIAARDATIRDLRIELEARGRTLLEIEAEVQKWKGYYFDVADAVCRDSTGVEDVCRKARDLRAQLSRGDCKDSAADVITLRNELRRLLDEGRLQRSDVDSINAALKAIE